MCKMAFQMLDLEWSDRHCSESKFAQWENCLYNTLPLKTVRKIGSFKETPKIPINLIHFRKKWQYLNGGQVICLFQTMHLHFYIQKIYKDKQKQTTDVWRLWTDLSKHYILCLLLFQLLWEHESNHRSQICPHWDGCSESKSTHLRNRWDTVSGQSNDLSVRLIKVSC